MQTGHVDRFDHHCITGWAADPDMPDVRLTLRIMVNGAEHGVIVADKPREGLRQRGIYGDGAHAFEYRFDPPLSPLREYNVVVRFGDNSADLPDGRFRIEPRRAQDLRLRPLLVTATGRSGTTLLMHRLGNGREIVTADFRPFEMKLLTYYAHALEVLTMAGSIKDPPSIEDAIRNPHQLGLNPMHHPQMERAYPDRAMLYHYFGRRTAARLSTAFGDIIDDFYQDMRVHSRKLSARFFAEKSDVFTPARTFAKLAFDGVKEILLVRDPRDIHCSRRAFWSDPAERSLQNLLSVQATVLPIWRADADSLLVIRYEDLVQNAADTMSRISAHLGLDYPIDLNPDIEQQVFSGHGTSADAASSIGRWKQDLSTDDQTTLSRAFKPYLEAFGYDTHVA
jgi:hypothetical protein